MKQRKSGLFWSVWLVGILLTSWGTRIGAQQLVGLEPNNIFFENTPVRFTSSVAPARRVTVRITDYRGSVVKEGEYATNAVTPGILPCGYYQLQLVLPNAPAPQSFVVVPRPPSRETGRVAVDAALTWLVPQPRYEEGAELLRRAGVRWVRDRLSWNEVEPQKGKFVWGRYEQAVNAQSKRNLNLVTAFHDSPKWTRTDGATNRFPR